MAGQIELELFADEIKEQTNEYTGEKWTYLGLMAVPLAKKEFLLKRLDDFRHQVGCHSELHGKKIESHNKIKLAKHWIEDVLYRDKESKSIYFQVCGLNHNRLNRGAFGQKEFDNMYNRFFRTATLGLLRRSFHKQLVKVVHNIYHDNSSMENHEYFPWHTMAKLNGTTADIGFHCETIRFIESDHRHNDGCDESHLIQLMDIILTGTSECLDFTSKREDRVRLGKIMYPLVKRMIHDPYNTKSSYGHAGKYLLSFFPEKKLTSVELRDEILRGQSGFYRNRDIIIEEQAFGQENLFG